MTVLRERLRKKWSKKKKPDVKMETKDEPKKIEDYKSYFRHLNHEMFMNKSCRSISMSANDGAHVFMKKNPDGSIHRSVHLPGTPLSQKLELITGQTFITEDMSSIEVMDW